VSAKAVISIFIPVLAGLASFVLFWWGAHCWEEFGQTGLFLSLTAICLVTASLISALSLPTSRAQSIVLSLIFSAGFVVAAAISATAIPERIYRPFAFWTVAALAMMGASYVGSVFNPRRHRSNQSLQPTAGRSDV
jgi:hypothetical protein